MKSSSWVIRNRTTKEVICETWNYHAVTCLNTQKYEAIPILEYLNELNQKIKDAA